MPRAGTASTSSPHFTRLVPTVARHTCYACGRQLLEEQEKQHCHLCYDVFCRRCTGVACVLVEYGYPTAAPQSVCGVCDALMASFPMLLSRIDDDAGGTLLLPQQRVWVTEARALGASDAGPYGDDGLGASTGDARGRLSADMPMTGMPAAALAAAINAAAKSRNSLPIANGMELALLSFRPINPETAIGIGSAARIPLRCIERVSRDGATVRLHCCDSVVDLTVGTLVIEYGRENPNPERERAASDSDQSSSQRFGTMARIRAFFGGASREETASGTSSRNASSGGPNTAAGRDAELVASATDVEVDAKAADMLEAGLRRLLEGVRRHFHFRPDVARMEALAASTAHAERERRGSSKGTTPRSPNSQRVSPRR